jgi:hypothetical protein
MLSRSQSWLAKNDRLYAKCIASNVQKHLFVGQTNLIWNLVNERESFVSAFVECMEARGRQGSLNTVVGPDPQCSLILLRLYEAPASKSAALTFCFHSSASDPRFLLIV